MWFEKIRKSELIASSKIGIRITIYILVIYIGIIGFSIIGGYLSNQTNIRIKENQKQRLQELIKTLPNSIVFSPPKVYFRKDEQSRTDIIENAVYIAIPIQLTLSAKLSDLKSVFSIYLADESGQTGYNRNTITGCSANGPSPLVLWDPDKRADTPYDESKIYTSGSYFLVVRYQYYGKYCESEKLTDLIGNNVIVYKYLPNSEVEKYQQYPVTAVEPYE